MDWFDNEGLEEWIRERAPADRYGLWGYYVSDDHFISRARNGQLAIGGDFSFDVGYLCTHVNGLLCDKLEDEGEEPTLMVGKDSYGIFSHHVFCETGDGRIIDGAPIFRFEGEDHDPKEEFFLSNDEAYLTCQNFVAAVKQDGDVYVLHIVATDQIRCKDYPRFTFRLDKNGRAQDESVGYEILADAHAYRKVFQPDWRIPKHAETAKFHLESLGRGGILIPIGGEGEKPEPNPQTELMTEILERYMPAMAGFLHKLIWSIGSDQVE